MGSYSKVQQTGARSKRSVRHDSRSSVAKSSVGAADGPVRNGKTSPLSSTALIRVMAVGNPKRPGTAAHSRWALLTDGMRVGDFLALGAQHPEWPKGWPIRDLRHALRRQLVRLVDGQAS